MTREGEFFVDTEGIRWVVVSEGKYNELLKTHEYVIEKMDGRGKKTVTTEMLEGPTYTPFRYPNLEAYHEDYWEGINNKGGKKFNVLWLGVNEGIRDAVSGILDYDYSDTKSMHIQYAIAYRICEMITTREKILFNNIRERCGMLCKNTHEVSGVTLEFCNHKLNPEQTEGNCGIQWCPLMGV